MKIKTNELIGPALDWVVAKCEGYPNITGIHPQGRIRIISGQFFNPSADWADGGPLIEREKISLEFMDNFETWSASIVREDGQDRESYSDDQDRESYTAEQESFVGYGPTPLIAAMRAFVASKLGDVVEIPEELG